MTKVEVPRLVAELVVPSSDQIGESPVWDDHLGLLLWVDITGGRIHQLDPITGTLHTRHFPGQHIGAIALRQPGEGYALAVRDGFALLEGEEITLIAPIEASPNPLVRMNDAKVDPRGRFWGGTLAYDLTPGAAKLYRLDGDAVAHVVDGLTCSNGMDWSDDGRTMYFVDSLAGGLDAFAFDMETGGLGERTRVVDIPLSDGMADGLTLDTDGNVWVGVYGAGEVRCYSPSGELRVVVEVGTPNVTSCAFGGGDLDVLFITSAAASAGESGGGSLYACSPETKGRPSPRMASSSARGKAEAP